MKVIIAIDSFKGSLTSVEAEEVAREGILQVHPNWQIDLIPIADGGEGMLGVMLACPGYASYCFQPNRILQAHRAEVDRFCRKVDEGGYDMSYARERHAGSTARKAGFGPLTRNFLGQKMMPGRDDSYASLFEMRFKSRAFIAALACRSYRAKYGKLPDCLDALVPEFLDEAPLDPYDGEKLRWNAEKGYFWTKGRDGDFNGVVEFGSDGKPRWKNRTYHWVQFLDTLIPLF